MAEATGPEARRDMAKRYFDAGVACPLLVDGRCSVRSVRPLACREYLVTSDPRHCATLDPAHVVRIRPRRNVLAGFGKVSAAFGEPKIVRDEALLGRQSTKTAEIANVAARNNVLALAKSERAPESGVVACDSHDMQTLVVTDCDTPC